MQPAPTTATVLAMRSLQRSLGPKAGEWATGQLMEGKDTPHLRQLAGATGAENRFELEELFDRTLHELGIVMPSRDEAIASWARELARDYLGAHITRRDFLHMVSDLCVESDYSRQIFPFYLLRFTLENLDYDGFSFHRADATKENFDALLGAEIERLLADEHVKA
ncbi:MAG TPA: hypothetical protein VGI60_01790 [Chthoniobacterales bacterium]|jgi:hypothetical protein